MRKEVRVARWLASCVWRRRIWPILLTSDVLLLPPPAAAGAKEACETAVAAAELLLGRQIPCFFGNGVKRRCPGAV